jgi:hypothetical protein
MLMRQRLNALLEANGAQEILPMNCRVLRDGKS